MTQAGAASLLQKLGAGGFGAIIGWYVYYVNRWRKGDVQLSDIVTVVGAVGGAAVLALFPKKTDLFGAYGIGLFIGFFSYFVVLTILVAAAPGFGPGWFLDGRRPQYKQSEMAADEKHQQRPLEGGRREP